MAADEAQQTKSHAQFEDNLARLVAVIEVFNEEWKRVGAGFAEMRNRLSARLEKVKRGEVDLPTPDEESLERQIKERSEAVRVANEFIDEWHVVMLVTFTEAYLEDVLAECAAADPDIMSQSEQTVSYEEVSSSGSVEELLHEIRHRWARNFVDDGGPGRWINRLGRMGARGYEEGDAMILEELWGIRHVVVHSAGKVTRDFARRHPRLGYAPGDALKLHNDQISDQYAPTVFRFVNVTDAFLLRRHMSS